LMTDAERRLNAEKWVEATPDDFKVIVHVGTNSTKTSCALAEHAQDIGAWGTSTMGPTFPKISRVEELVRYCEDLASGAPELPFYYYHIPAFSRVELPMLDFLKAVDGRIPNFAGIKYTFESLYEYTHCRRYKNGKYDLLHGQDETLLASLALGGATGCIGGTFNYAASLYTGIQSAFASNDLDEARRLQFLAMDMIDVICKYRGNIVGGKQIMKLIGLDLGPNRAPFQGLTGDEYTSMKADLEAINFSEFQNKVAMTAP
jgi:N-acetylneuraminate lyase